MYAGRYLYRTHAGGSFCVCLLIITFRLHRNLAYYCCYYLFLCVCVFLRQPTVVVFRSFPGDFFHFSIYTPEHTTGMIIIYNTFVPVCVCVCISHRRRRRRHRRVSSIRTSRLLYTRGYNNLYARVCVCVGLRCVFFFLRVRVYLFYPRRVVRSNGREEEYVRCAAARARLLDGKLLSISRGNIAEE